MTGSGVTQFSVIQCSIFDKGLTRSLEIGSTTKWVLPNICRLGWVCHIPYLAQMSLMKSHWMQQNPKVTVFTVSELLKENQQAGKITSHSCQHSD